MAGMSVDGLISGLDTTSLINQLMQAEAAPQTSLKAKVTANQAVIAGYQSINTKFAALQSAAELLGKAETWSTPSATSSSTSVTAMATAGAASGQIRFDVTAVAAAHSLATDAFAQLADIAATMPPVLHGMKSGVSFTITPADGTLAGVLAAINSATDAAGAALGLTATAVQVAPGSFRLQVTAKGTGAAGGFTLDGLGATTLVRQGADAKVDLGGGLVVTSATNTFKDLMPGVSFTVGKVENAVTVTAAVDPNALADRVQAMVTAANAALADIDRLTAYDSATKKGAPLLGDHTVRQLEQAALGAVAVGVAGSGSPHSGGIAVDRNGRLTFDRAKFVALESSDPARAQALAQGVAGRLAEVAKGATDSAGGSLTLAAQGRTSTVKDLTRRIEDWDQRLALRKAALQRQFGAMETALSGLKSQSSWLAGQLATLDTSSSS